MIWSMTEWNSLYNIFTSKNLYMSLTIQIAHILCVIQRWSNSRPFGNQSQTHVSNLTTILHRYSDHHCNILLTKLSNDRFVILFKLLIKSCFLRRSICHSEHIILITYKKFVIICYQLSDYLLFCGCFKSNFVK